MKVFASEIVQTSFVSANPAFLEKIASSILVPRILAIMEENAYILREFSRAIVLTDFLESIAK